MSGGFVLDVLYELRGFGAIAFSIAFALVLHKPVSRWMGLDDDWETEEMTKRKDGWG